jgi:hypothetical protein
MNPAVRPALSTVDGGSARHAGAGPRPFEAEPPYPDRRDLPWNSSPHPLHPQVRRAAPRGAARKPLE